MGSVFEQCQACGIRDRQLTQLLSRMSLAGRRGVVGLGSWVVRGFLKRLVDLVGHLHLVQLVGKIHKEQPMTPNPFGVELDVNSTRVNLRWVGTI